MIEIDWKPPFFRFRFSRLNREFCAWFRLKSSGFSGQPENMLAVTPVFSGYPVPVEPWTECHPCLYQTCSLCFFWKIRFSFSISGLIQSLDFLLILMKNLWRKSQICQNLTNTKIKDFWRESKSKMLKRKNEIFV